MNLSPLSNSQTIGKAFEKLAQDFLCQQGLVFIEANSHSQRGEIDLIMQDHNHIVFIEVKYRGINAKVSALSAITASKQKKCIKAAQFWLNKNPQHQHKFCRFDCIGIEPKTHNTDVSTSYMPTFSIKKDNQTFILSWLKNGFM